MSVTTKMRQAVLLFFSHYYITLMIKMSIKSLQQIFDFKLIWHLNKEYKCNKLNAALNCWVSIRQWSIKHQEGLNDLLQVLWMQTCLYPLPDEWVLHRDPLKAT